MSNNWLNCGLAESAFALSASWLARALGTSKSKLMNDTISFRFESKLHSPTERVWEWITSIKGISDEMWPIFRMTFPKDVLSLNDVNIKLGVRMFRSYVFLFGVMPIDYSDMTLVELNIGVGFIEQSPMGSMKLWRHERRILPCPSDPDAVLLVDQLTFQPRMAKRLVGWFIRRFFIHRHEVLKTNLGGAQPAAAKP
jgi:ligand-binding SRPBCC domain-containing protein